MISTANLTDRIQNIPSAWIFQHYCTLPEALSGQELKITSVFKPTERTPSMVLYCDNNTRYKFNDFSTGKKGDGIDLVKFLFGLDNRQSTSRIIADYNNFVLNNGEFKMGALKPTAKYKVTAHETRLWNTDDAKYWTSFNIGSRMLELYQVKPLKSYTMIKGDEDGPKSFTVERPYVYGYFKKDGTLYKIYQPLNQERKFLKVQSGYIQGSEQHGKNNKILLLTSSMKDTMCIRSLGIKKTDFDSPDSETVGLDPIYVESIKAQYPQILVLFDSDSAGIDAMRKYKAEYGFDFVFFNLAKDPSDAIRKLGPKPVRDHLVIKINQQLIPEL